MARTPDLARRRQLLNSLIDEFADGGIGDRSLRQIADAVGTSHRMLLHHFGSREELLLTVVEEVEQRQMGLLPELPSDAADGFTTMWADLRRPELRRLERLFFECYARAAQGEKPFARMVPNAVNDWLGAVDAAAKGTADPAMARLGLAVTRGLLLDLVATNDDRGVDAAAQAFADLLRFG
ncbi:TetR/AcrR family transcriptional regulator [Mycobacterium ahvazicum]|uniref:TetR/AcrR family transcriptional regulator n=1 Tax=Mycobacterium ahvazicum TaxID=1964395 RepID=A0A2K4Y7W5_9MYCO|nr:TetR/AcrR family transcriptional regulator [Mycobacterium ahvazicum]SOX52886.1 TetR/AcrR family transcriptional regulator [Mycobacterium ahvazicum]